MKKTTSKRGSVYGTALRSVATVAVCGSLLWGGYSYIERGKELDKAKKEIVHYESSLKHQVDINTGLEKDLSALEKRQMDLKSKNDTLLKDKAELNQKLKSEEKENSQLQQKLKQTESEVRELKRKK